MNTAPQQIQTPKLGKESKQGRISWYKYYAGYSPKFVKDAIRLADCSSGAVVLDPWNGSGTTTQVAFEEGHRAIGFDLNPVMVIVAKARIIDPSVVPSIQSLLDDILAKAEKTSVDRVNREPLTSWLRTPTAITFRTIERSIYSLLVKRNGYTPLAEASQLSSVSSLAAFFYVALFRSLREALTPLRTSNPTWIKQPKTVSERLSLSHRTVFSVFRSTVKAMHRDLVNEPEYCAAKRFQPTVDLASSHHIPLGDDSVDLIVTSPPYCTRIDYVVKTLPELAIIGASEAQTRTLRESMIGTPTISKTQPSIHNQWGPICLSVLDQIYNHASYASRSYYWKTLVQYFGGLSTSLDEVDRLLRPGGHCVMVLQDSYYKDLRINLPGIVVEMTTGKGWNEHSQVDFLISRSMADINTAARTYPKGRSSAESVITFQKPY